MGIFRFWRNGEFTFSKRCGQTLYSSQRAAGKSVLFSQPGESPILPQQAGGCKNFSQEGRFCLTKKERETKNSPWSQEERKFHRKNRNAGEILNRFLQFLPLLLYLLCYFMFSGRKVETKSLIFFYLFNQILRYFVFARRKMSSEQIFQRSAIVDCSWNLYRVEVSPCNIGFITGYWWSRWALVLFSDEFSTTSGIYSCLPHENRYLGTLNFEPAKFADACRQTSVISEISSWNGRIAGNLPTHHFTVGGPQMLPVTYTPKHLRQRHYEKLLHGKKGKILSAIRIHKVLSYHV